MKRYWRAFLAAIAAMRPAWNASLAPHVEEHALDSFKVRADLNDGRGLQLMYSGTDERAAAVAAEKRIKQRCQAVAFEKNGELQWVRDCSPPKPRPEHPRGRG